MEIVKITIAAIAITAYATIGINQIVSTSGFDVKLRNISGVKLESTTDKLKSLEKRYSDVQLKIDNGSADTVDKLKSESESLKNQIQQLEKQLQSKLDAKNKANELAAKTIDAVTGASPAAAMPPNNEAIAWSYLRSAGYSDIQTAGIMGNLRQEHGFNTSDVPGGLGIAQWIGNRRSALINRGNYLDINAQLDYLVWELNNTETAASSALKASTSIEAATIAFQNNFERCGVCMESSRIGYAYDILARYR